MLEQPQRFPQIFAEELAAIRGGPPHDAHPLSALCLSGGGIRSATFCLGVIQGLANRGLLPAFDYMSTVSGGGYIGSWLTAWIHHAGGVEEVAERLGTDRAYGQATSEGTVDPVDHLRQFNSYLTPNVGPFSIDSWTVFSIVLRNILLNWVVLVPLILFVLMAPRIMLSILSYSDYTYAARQPAHWDWVIGGIGFLGMAVGGVAVYNILRFLPSVGNVPHTQGDFVRLVFIPLIASTLLVNVSFSWSPYFPEWRECLGVGFSVSLSGWILFLAQQALRNGKAALRFFFGPLTLALLLAALCMAGAIWVMYHKIFNLPWVDYPAITTIAPPMLMAGFLLASGLFIGLTSGFLKEEDREWFSRAGAHFFLFLFAWPVACGIVLEAPEAVLGWHDWKQPALASMGLISGAISTFAGFSSKTRSKVEKTKPPLAYRLALGIAPILFVAIFFVGLAMLTDWICVATGMSNSPWWRHDGVLKDASIWSNALLAMVLLALGLALSVFINPNRFSLHAMYRGRLVRAYLGASNPHRKADAFTGFAENDNIKMGELRPAQRPFPILNVTLNLVGGHNLAWQQRKAEPMSISPLHCGNPALGYRPSATYARGISLGTAMTISGAAASPNMGYHSSQVVTFIMTLFNARLGAWLGNPGVRGSETWKDDSPRYAIASVVKEALGLTDDTSSYVYLSDGGHFENLGLYEMVRRRCQVVVVLDGSCDMELHFEDLGNALRKIRIDMNVPIEFDDRLMRGMLEGKKRCAVGRIRYSCADSACSDGYVIYIKPMILGSEPPDVLSYHAKCSEFPHESTADQWFTESQTESYRILGLETMKDIGEGWAGGTLEEFRQHVESTYLKSE